MGWTPKIVDIRLAAACLLNRAPTLELQHQDAPENRMRFGDRRELRP